MNNQLFKNVDDYIMKLFATEDSSLIAAQKDATDANMPEISITPVQGKLLHTLALTCNAKKILEIGTLGGYSTIWLARALPEDGHLITIELDPHHAEIARANIKRAGLEPKVTIRVGSALEVLPEIKSEKLGPFDMIFIDADKPSYPEYLKYSLQLSRPGTLIIADNVIREGDVLDENSSDERVVGARRFNSMLAVNPALTSIILQTVGAKEHDGMSLAVVNR